MITWQHMCKACICIYNPFFLYYTVMIAMSSFALRPFDKPDFFRKRYMPITSKLKIWLKGLNAFKVLQFAWTNKNTNHKHEITNMNKTSNTPFCWMVAHWNECSIKFNIWKINIELGDRLWLLLQFFPFGLLFWRENFFKNHLGKKNNNKTQKQTNKTHTKPPSKMSGLLTLRAFFPLSNLCAFLMWATNVHLETEMKIQVYFTHGLVLMFC